MREKYLEKESVARKITCFSQGQMHFHYYYKYAWNNSAIIVSESDFYTRLAHIASHEVTKTNYKPLKFA